MPGLIVVLWRGFRHEPHKRQGKKGARHAMTARLDGSGLSPFLPPIAPASITPSAHRPAYSPATHTLSPSPMDVDFSSYQPTHLADPRIWKHNPFQLSLEFRGLPNTITREEITWLLSFNAQGTKRDPGISVWVGVSSLHSRRGGRERTSAEGQGAGAG